MNPRQAFSFLRQRRHQVIALVFALQAAALYSFSRDTTLPPIPALRELSDDLKDWRLSAEGIITQEAAAILSPDDYLVRDYVEASSNRVANLFVAYFKTQRNERMPHSPKNCLPGNGWTSSSYKTAMIPVPGAAAPVNANSYVIQKGDERAVVLYWYQTWNRTVANEYLARIYLAADSIRYHRTDTALVRILVPVPEGAAPEDYEKTAIRFVQVLYPQLQPYFPST